MESLFKSTACIQNCEGETHGSRYMFEYQHSSSKTAVSLQRKRCTIVGWFVQSVSMCMAGMLMLACGAFSQHRPICVCQGFHTSLAKVTASPLWHPAVREDGGIASKGPWPPDKSMRSSAQAGYQAPRVAGNEPGECMTGYNST